MKKGGREEANKVLRNFCSYAHYSCYTHSFMCKHNKKFKIMQFKIAEIKNMWLYKLCLHEIENLNCLNFAMK